MKMTSTKSVAQQWIKGLLFGKSGEGKTSTALTLDPKTTLILSAESGLLPLRHQEFTVWELESWQDVMDAYVKLLDPKVAAQFNTVFIDSLTEINELAKEQIVKKDRPALGVSMGKQYDDLMTQQDWGLLSTRMTRMIRAYRDLPFNVIFTCLEDTVKDEKTGAITVVPSINGKLAQNIAGYFDEVFRMVKRTEGDKESRYFVTSAEGAITKDRSGSLARIEPANWTTVYGKIFNTDKPKAKAA
jgi:hypothetical protein